MSGTEEGAPAVPETFDVGAAVDTIAGEMGLGEEGGKKEPTTEGAAPGGEAGTEGEQASQKPADGTGAPAPAAPAQVAAPAAPVAGDTPPDTWTAAGKAEWASLSPAVKAEVLKREGDMVRGLEDYGKRAKVGDFFAEQVSPFAEVYAQHGLQIGRLVGPALNAYATMAWGDAEQKAVMFKALAQDAGLDLAKLASGDANGAVDPRIQRLQNELVQLRLGVQQSLGAVQETRFAETSKNVEAFAADEAKHPYFWDVIDDMRRLVDSKIAKGLDDAYDMAVMGNPVTRAKEIDRLAAEKLAEKTKEAADKVAKVKRATGAHVRSSEQGGAAPDKLGTIDDTLKETLAAIHARE